MTALLLTETFSARVAAAVGSWPLERGLARVVLVEVDAWRPELASATDLLDPVEADRVARRRRPRDRDDLALCYGLHRALLAAWLGCPPREVPLYRDERGCPRLDGADVSTSLSHADGAFAFVFARAEDGPVGIDLEPRDRADVMHEVAAALCHPAELEAHRRKSRVSAAASMLRLWVRKEAVLKALGTGMEVPMDSFAVPDSGVVHLVEYGAPPLRATFVDAGALQYECAVAHRDDVQIASAWLRP